MAPRKPKPRRRLEAAAARAVILDAAEKRLVESGAAGIRLQEVAADAGVSHPTVLHHFGSRELLVKAVISRALQAINQSLVEGIGASTGDEGQLGAMIEAVYRALADGGHGRVIMWLALEGHPIDGAEVRLSHVVDATHALRLERRKRRKGPRAPRQDTAYLVVLATLALVGSTVIGPTLLENAGAGRDAKVGVQFRAWLTRLLSRHMDAR